MFKKYLTLILPVLVLNLFLCASVFAETKEEKAAKLSEKVKADITKLGTGTDARVEVKLKDGTKIKGYVSQINDTNFVVVNEKTGMATEIAYPNAKQVKGKNLSSGAKIAIVVGAVVGAIIIIGLIFAHKD